MNRNKINTLAQTRGVFKQALLVSAVLSALTATSLQAQESDAAEADDGGIERIFVTASKRQTGLQQTPIAVTVVAGEAIERTKVLDIGDLQTLVPTLRVTPLQRSTNTTFSIRGFGNGGNNVGIEPSVGIFIDGVYRSRAAAQIGDLPRLEQIEVLSGPQSTLFGKNASAGVINVRTQAPSYDFEGKVEAGVGNYNQRILKGYITSGITDDLAFSVSAGMNTRDGFSKSIVPDTNVADLNDRDRFNLRGQFLYEPIEDVTIRLIADYSEIEEVCCTVSAAVEGPSTAVIRFAGGIALSAEDPFAYESALNTAPINNVEDSGISAQVDVDFDNFAFTSITAFRTNDSYSGKSNTGNDIDYTSLDILRNATSTEIETFTQEFRLTSTGDNALDWMFGAFIFSEEVFNGEDLTFGEDVRSFFDILLGAGGLPPGFLGTVEGLYPNVQAGDFFAAGQAVDTHFVQQNDAYSIFANFDYKFSDALVGTIGVSYTNDEKEITIDQVVNNDIHASFDYLTEPTVLGVPLIPVLTGGFIADGLPPAAAAATANGLVGALQGLQFIPGFVNLPNSVEDNESSDSKTTWSLRLAYEFDENFNFFATAATGFKATSWNLTRDSRPFPTDLAGLTSAGLTQPNQTTGTRFASPEEATVYELGMKSSFQRGAFNITLFDQTIEGFQSSTFVGTGFVLANAGQQSTQGIEFDSLYRATDDITLTFAGTILDPIYDSFEGASGWDEVNQAATVIDLTGQKPSNISERSFTLGVTYDFELGDNMFGYARVDYAYESDARLVYNVPASLRHEVSTFNASAGLDLDNGVKLQLWVRNLTNDETFLSSFPAPIQNGSFNAYPSQPRTFGASVSYDFF
ncbi:MAG: iron complex outermembrane receptor protein [Paraglaciecola sp.]|jgi:outer membrane receptor protein involved in Fe transport